MAKGRGTVLPLPDGIPGRLEGGYRNELPRCGDVLLRLTEAPAASVAWKHRLLEEVDRRPSAGGPAETDHVDEPTLLRNVA